MKLKVISCMVLSKEIYYLACNSKHEISVCTVPQKLHTVPEKLSTVIQNKIDEAEQEDNYNAICLAYGLCSNAAVGLHSSKIPLVITKAHDCITLLLGNRKKYNKLFDHYNGGAYWYSKGWIANDLFEMPSPRHFEKIREIYKDKFDEECIEYLISEEKKWVEKYNSLVFIDWNNLDTENEQKETAEIADALNLEYILESGSDKLLRKLLNGQWDSNDFLIVEPGKSIAPSNDYNVLTTGDIKAQGEQETKEQEVNNLKIS